MVSHHRESRAFAHFAGAAAHSPFELVRERVSALGTRISGAADAIWMRERVSSVNSGRIGAHEMDAAIEAARAQAAHGRLLTLAYWSLAGDAPAQIAAQYLAGVDAIAAAGLPCSISIKVDAVGFQRDLLRPLFSRARECGVRLHFDAQACDAAARTFALLEEAREMGAAVSASIAARWRRSIDDAERMIALGVPVSIVKGRDGDPGAPKVDPRRAFLDLVYLCAGRATHVGVATHDRLVAEPALDVLKNAGGSRCLEQLTWSPRLDFLAERRGTPVLVHIGYGRVGPARAPTVVMSSSSRSARFPRKNRT